MADDLRPLVAHVMYRFDTGGLENGVVNLINHMDPEAYRHAVIALTEVTDFRLRIRRNDVEFVSLHKTPGHGFWQYPQLFRVFRRLRPSIVHSRNLAALEAQVPAWAARVPVRIHGEHGWDVTDRDGSNITYQRLRRLYRPFVNHYMALSRESATYLTDKVRVPGEVVTQVYNGVDTVRFCPPVSGAPSQIDGCPFDPSRQLLIGTVGRMQPVKDQVLLAKAFVLALQKAPTYKDRVRLVLVGDGPLRAQAQRILDDAGLSALAWLPGERSDIPDVLRGLHLFVLPSLAEGISNTILEAMACGLPVLATAVGGNLDLVDVGRTGHIVPPADADVMAQHIVAFCAEPARGQAMGLAGRARVESRFSMSAMVGTYQRLYDQQLQPYR